MAGVRGDRGGNGVAATVEVGSVEFQVAPFSAAGSGGGGGSTQSVVNSDPSQPVTAITETY
jgi:hypothetical protein